MTAGALLDTSCLITLTNRLRANHAVAEDYYRYMIKNRIPMYVSTIAVAEFTIRQKLTDLPLHRICLLPFNVLHGIDAGRLGPEIKRETGEARNVTRDDVKLLAQAHREQIPIVMTEDRNTLAKWCKQLREKSLIQVRSVVLNEGFSKDAMHI